MAILTKRTLTAGLAGSAIANGLHIKQRADDTVATVNIEQTTGTPQHLASGFIYGIPDTPDQIPDRFYTGIDFQYGRAGGAQLQAPARGWIWGLEEYKGRLNSTLSNYETCRKYDAKFLILPHDVWGTDHANASTVWPGDNGDWTDYDNFIDTLLSDLAAADALEGMVFEIWNEPDLPGVFWNRTQQQWLDLYVRTHKMIRANPDYDILGIAGPSLAGQPSVNNTWWTTWLDTVAGNNTIPTQYGYHLEGSPSDPIDDPQTTNGTLSALLSTYGLPELQVNINEYATSPEQRPAGAAWWISRLERYDMLGLRGNWLSGTTLHDLQANLLTKADDPENYTATDYLPTGEWQVYNYYAQNMTGQRLATNGSEDRLFDVYATLDGCSLKVLAGSRVTAGNWSVQLDAFAGDGCVDVHAYAFPGVTQYSVLEAPVDKGVSEVTFTGGILTLEVQSDNTTAYAFEMEMPQASK